MQTDNSSEKIKVYCAEHQTICEVKAKSRLVCTVEEHTLSTDFPQAEFWEYCCDCQTFLPTKLGVGGAAIANCPNCDREAARRFVCRSCKTAAFESDEPARGKIYRLQTENGIEPSCPGCRTNSQNEAAVLHKCREIKSEFFTSRPICPFCLENTIVVNAPVKAAPSANAMQICPQCQAENIHTAIFCGKCKYQLQKGVAVANLGSDVNKTQLLGSLCPNCSTPIPPDSGFCGECGQAVKKAAPPPPPPPPKFKAAVLSSDAQISPTTVSTSNNAVRNMFIGVGAFCLFIVVLAVVSNTSKSSSSSYNSNTNSAVVVNSNTRMANGRSSNTTSNSQVTVSKTPNKSSSDSRIGKTGTLTRDANLRETANKDSYKLGTHYRGARIKILDVETVPNSLGGTTDWFKIEVTSYGESMDANNYGQSKDPGSEDVGWINSYPEIYENYRKTRVAIVDFD